MALSKNEAIKISKDFLVACSQKHDIRRAYLFGSFARGAVSEYSDIDLAVILGNTRASEDSPYDEDFEIFHEAQQHNSLIEVICFSENDFEQEGSALARRIKKEGIMVMP